MKFHNFLAYLYGMYVCMYGMVFLWYVFVDTNRVTSLSKKGLKYISPICGISGVYKQESTGHYIVYLARPIMYSKGLSHETSIFSWSPVISN